MSDAQFSAGGTLPCRSSARRAARALGALLALAGALAAAAPAAATPADRVKREQTQQTMRALLEALLGSGDSSGYVADMGQLPASLAGLAAAAVPNDPLLPVFALLSGGVGMGYRGPYLPRAAAAAQSFVDAWGTPIELLAGSGTVQLRSAGPDRDSATSADNILYPTSPRATHGLLEVKLDCGTTGSSAVAPCATGEASVRVYFSSAGTESSTTALSSGASLLQFPNLHVGSHYVVAQAVNPSGWQIASASDVVLLRGRKATSWLRLVGPAAAEEEEDEEEDEEPGNEDEVQPICHKPNSKNAKTLYLTASSRQSHLDHGDTSGVCP
jgi:hypothetical protein